MSVKLKEAGKSIIDIDLILGMLLALFLDYIFAYIASKVYTPLSGRPFTTVPALDVFGYDDLCVFGIEIAAVIIAKGRMRKIFATAIWFNAFVKIYEMINILTGQGALTGI